METSPKMIKKLSWKESQRLIKPSPDKILSWWPSKRPSKQDMYKLSVRERKGK